MRHIRILSLQKELPMYASSLLVKQHQAVFAASIVGIVAEIITLTTGIVENINAPPGENSDGISEE